jgi:hypothetical protein
VSTAGQILLTEGFAAISMAVTAINKRQEMFVCGFSLRGAQIEVHQLPKSSIA